MDRTVSSRTDFVRPQTATHAPMLASLCAIAAPTPRPAPVTTATCPASSAVPAMSCLGAPQELDGRTPAVCVTFRILAREGGVGQTGLACHIGEQVLIIRTPETEPSLSVRYRGSTGNFGILQYTCSVGG